MTASEKYEGPLRVGNGLWVYSQPAFNAKVMFTGSYRPKAEVATYSRKQPLKGFRHVESKPFLLALRLEMQPIVGVHNHMRTRRLWAVSLVLFLILSRAVATEAAGRNEQKTFADPLVAALVIAVSDGNFSEADNMLKAGADVNAVGLEGLTPLLWIMGTTLNVGKIEYLLKAGANPNYRDEKSLASPMYLAAGGNRPDILELLLKFKGNPDLFGPQDMTLLMIAVAQLRDKNFDLLLKYGADINQANRHNHTIAHEALIYGRYDLVAKYLDMGLTHDIQNLARYVDMIKVRPDSEQQQWKNKVIEMLKSRGATFPAFIPRKVE
jgi:hypothetical protein